MMFLYIQTTQSEPGMSSKSSIQASTTLKVLLSPLKGPHCSEGVRLRMEGTKRDRFGSIQSFVHSFCSSARDTDGVLVPPGGVGHNGQGADKKGEEEECDQNGLHLGGSACATRRLAVHGEAELQQQGQKGKKTKSKGLYEAKGRNCFSPFSRLIKYSSMWLPAWLEFPIILVLFGPPGID